MLEVTADMRDEFFEKNGYMGTDDVVEAWHKREIEKNSEPTQINSMEDLNELSIVGEEDGNTNTDRHKNDTRDKPIHSNNIIGSNNDRCNNNSKQTISIKDDNGKEYKFVKPEFECELIAIDSDNQIVGLTYPNNRKTLTYFDISGKAFRIDKELLRWKNKDLTPIKPKWYEDSYENLHNKVVFHKTSKTFLVISRVIDEIAYYTRYGSDNVKELRLATKEECMSLFFQDKE